MAPIPLRIQSQEPWQCKRGWGPVAVGQRVLARVHLVLMPLESEVCTGWHIEGGGRAAIGSTDVTCQVCRSDISN